MNKISQREARKTRAELAALQNWNSGRLNAWSSDFPGGVNIASEEMTAISCAKLKIAMSLGFVVVCKLDAGTVRYFAVKP